MIEPMTIDPARFDDAALIESGPPGMTFSVRLCDTSIRMTARSTCQQETRKAAEPYLDPAERILVGWLAIRTEGYLGDSDGMAEMTAARSARYRREERGYADVRVLNLDEVDGRSACLCANCHVILTRWRPD